MIGDSGEKLVYKRRFFLKALSFLTFWIPACAGMAKTVCVSPARHARVGGHPGFLLEALALKKLPIKGRGGDLLPVPCNLGFAES